MHLIIRSVQSVRPEVMHPVGTACTPQGEFVYACMHVRTCVRTCVCMYACAYVLYIVCVCVNLCLYACVPACTEMDVSDGWGLMVLPHLVSKRAWHVGAGASVTKLGKSVAKFTPQKKAR